jgi:hypothetical protein
MGHFALVIDMMAHGDFSTEEGSTPFRGCSQVTYLPQLNHVWFD